MDLPHVLYFNDNKKKGGKDYCGSSKNTKASDRVLRLQEEANRQMMKEREKEAKAAGEKPYELEELFSKE